MYSIKPQAMQLLTLLTEGGSRYDAMSALWLGLRSTSAIDDVGYYSLLFLIWLAAKAVLSRDPVFGPIVEELYAFTLQRYSCLALFPLGKTSSERAMNSLRWIGMSFNQEPEAAGVQIHENALVQILSSDSHVVKQLSNEWRRRFFDLRFPGK